MLRDIRACVETEPATGPWFAVRFSETRFAILKRFPIWRGGRRMSMVEGAISFAT